MASFPMSTVQGHILLLVCVWTISTVALPAGSCVKKSVIAIPRWHIYHRLCKPIVIGHRGNPLHFQENTFEGFKSVRRFGANAFELDVYLTKDGKLVLFHDKNALRTTGVNRPIQDMTSKEIKKLRYLKKIKYGPNIITYRRRRKVVFLERVLRWAKGKKILIVLEMKPTDVLLNAAKVKNTIKTSRAVAKMVKKYKMHDQVLAISFNYYATISAKRAYHKLVVGTFIVDVAWRFPPVFYHLINTQMVKLLPGLKGCLKNLPSSNKTMDYYFVNGVMEKFMRASYTFITPVIFNNPQYGGQKNKKTMKMVRRSYGKGFVVGTGGFFDIKLPQKKVSAVLALHRNVIKLGAKMIITDDLIKTKRLIRSAMGRKCHHHHYHRHGHNYNYNNHDELARQDHEIEAASRV